MSFVRLAFKPASWAQWIILTQMSSKQQIAAAGAVQRIRWILAITIVWMTVEASISLFAAWHARSPALLAFGGDSAIELLSAVIVLWRFSAATPHEQAERRAARLAGGLLFLLAAYVIAAALFTLLGYSESRPTVLGIVILAAAAVIMPLLAKEKRRLSRATKSAALRADAAESALCAYLSLIALAGLVVASLWRVRWADPIAALAIVPFVAWEGREAFHGQPCDCC